MICRHVVHGNYGRTKSPEGCWKAAHKIKGKYIPIGKDNTKKILYVFYEDSQLLPSFPPTDDPVNALLRWSITKFIKSYCMIYYFVTGMKRYKNGMHLYDYIVWIGFYILFKCDNTNACTMIHIIFISDLSYIFQHLGRHQCTRSAELFIWALRLYHYPVSPQTFVQQWTPW